MQEVHSYALCYVKKLHFPCSSLTELTAQCNVSIGVISLGCETNLSNVPDPNQESHSGARVTRGYVGPLWMDRQGTVNLKRPGAQVQCVYLAAFTSDVITL